MSKGYGACLVMSKIGLCFGITSFRAEGRQPSWYEVFKISWTGLVSRSAFFLSSHPGIPSGPWSLVGLTAESFLNTDLEAAVTVNVDSEERFESRVGFCVSGWKSFIGERKLSLTRFARAASVVTPASPLFKRGKDLIMFSLAPDPFDIPLHFL